MNVLEEEKMKQVIVLIFIASLFSGFPKIIHASDSPVVSSGSAILIDANTGEVLFEKKATEEMYPASLTKIATAIYAIEKGNLNDIVTIGSNPRKIEGTRVYLEEGERVSLRKLIQGLLINSGNDAGVAIAEHMDGSIETFSKNLNSYLAGLGLKNTVFMNPHGLFNPEHVTTAEDLATLTQYAMENQEFSEIFGTKELEWKGVTWKTTLYTHHKLMRELPYEGVIGGKTGYVDQSGHTLVTAAKRKELSLIVVTLNASSQELAYDDTKKLLDYGFNHYKTSSIAKGTSFKVNDGSYTAKKMIYFTQNTKENMNNSIIVGERMAVLNPSEKFLSAVQHGTITEKTKEKKDKEKNKETKNESKEQDIGLYFGLVLILAIAFFILVKIRINKKQLQKDLIK